MIPTELAIAGALTTALVGFALGWDWSVHKYRAEKRELETATQGLETEIATFHALAARDPQRAWINLGKDNVLINLERYVAQLRERLEPHS